MTSFSERVLGKIIADERRSREIMGEYSGGYKILDDGLIRYATAVSAWEDKLKWRFSTEYKPLRTSKPTAEEFDPLTDTWVASRPTPEHTPVSSTTPVKEDIIVESPFASWSVAAKRALMDAFNDTSAEWKEQPSIHVSAEAPPPVTVLMSSGAYRKDRVGLGEKLELRALRMGKRNQLIFLLESRNNRAWEKRGVQHAEIDETALGSFFDVPQMLAILRDVVGDDLETFAALADKTPAKSRPARAAEPDAPALTEIECYAEWGSW